MIYKKDFIIYLSIIFTYFENKYIHQTDLSELPFLLGRKVTKMAKIFGPKENVFFRVNYRNGESTGVTRRTISFLFLGYIIVDPFFLFIFFFEKIV